VVGNHPYYFLKVARESSVSFSVRLSNRVTLGMIPCDCQLGRRFLPGKHHVIVKDGGITKPKAKPIQQLQCPYRATISSYASVQCQHATH